MGRPNPVLCIVVADQWAHHPRVEELRIAGHDVYTLSEWRCLLVPKDPDAILHPAAHGWNDELWDDLDVALKAARKRRKERKG